MRLSYKIFGASLLTTLTIVGLTIGTQVFGHRNFIDFVGKMEMERLSDLDQMLTTEYQTAGNWRRLNTDPELWRSMIRKAGYGHQGQGGMPPPPPPPRDFPRQPDRMSLDGRPPALPPGRDFLEGPSRIFLLDVEKHLIAGRRESPDDGVLRELSVDNKTIGWLGITKIEPRLTPPELAFLERQKQLVYLMGACTFILTALVSFFLSRHLLTPIKQLIAGTRALASRKLTTRLEVRSGDELGQLVADFNVMAQTLEQYEEMRKQWISDISHELRTPLSILRGEIEAMQDGVRVLNNEALESLYFEAVHLGKIVDDLHELSMADSGALHLERRSIDPIVVLKETLRVFQTRFEQAEIVIRDDRLPDKRVSLLGDGGRLAQLYANILENTLRYADIPGTLRIWCDLSSAHLHLVFEDSGPGVPKEAVNRLFDRLYRVDSARTRNKGGSGLGLAICKTIVESHGGTIRAVNAASGGLRIEITLPITSTTTNE